MGRLRQDRVEGESFWAMVQTCGPRSTDEALTTVLRTTLNPETTSAYKFLWMFPRQGVGVHLRPDTFSMCQERGSESPLFS